MNAGGSPPETPIFPEPGKVPGSFHERTPNGVTSSNDALCSSDIERRS